MPTISQLPLTEDVVPADSVPVSQDGTMHAVSIGTLLSSMQPAIISDTATLLGRVSLGPGGPEQIAVGAGLLLNDGTLVAAALANLSQQAALAPNDHIVVQRDGLPALVPPTSLRSLFSPGAYIDIDADGTIAAVGVGGISTPFRITELPVATAMASGDLVAISQGGSDRAVSYANLLDGLTIDLASPAAPAADEDAFWVSQGSSTMLRQTCAAVWAWLTGKLPSHRLPVVEITTDTTLDGIAHNGRILICSQAVTLAQAAPNMGSGFHCDILNLSGGQVTFGSGIITSSGSMTLSSGQAATLRVVTYSGGTVVFASLAGTTGGGGGSAPPEAPGQTTGLAAGSPTSNAITLNWTPPISGGSVASYTVQYRVTGNPTWSTFASGIGTTSVLVTGLTASTTYQFQVYAVNAGGAGAPSASASASTVAVAGNVTAITWFMVPIGPYSHGSGSIGVNAMITPADAAVQFGFSTSATVPPSSWVAAMHVNTNIWGAYVSTPATAGTWYAWVEGTDGSLPTVHPTPFTVT